MSTLVRAAVLTNYFEVAAHLGLNPQPLLRRVNLSRKLLADPAAEWSGHALSTWLQNNHSIRTQDWRYTRYADGSEELYDHRNDPYEWTNLAADEKHASVKRELAALFPTKNVPGLTDTDGWGGPGKGQGKGKGKNNNDD